MLTLDFEVGSRGQVQLTSGLREPVDAHNVQEVYEILQADAAMFGVTTTRVLSLRQGPVRIPLGSEFTISFYREHGEIYVRVEDAVTGSSTQTACENLGDAFVFAMEWLQIL